MKNRVQDLFYKIFMKRKKKTCYLKENKVKGFLFYGCVAQVVRALR